MRISASPPCGRSASASSVNTVIWSPDSGNDWMSNITWSNDTAVDIQESPLEEEDDCHRAAQQHSLPDEIDDHTIAESFSSADYTPESESMLPHWAAIWSTLEGVEDLSSFVPKKPSPPRGSSREPLKVLRRRPRPTATVVGISEIAREPKFAWGTNGRKEDRDFFLHPEIEMVPPQSSLVSGTLTLDSAFEAEGRGMYGRLKARAKSRIMKFLGKRKRSAGGIERQ